LNKRIQTVSTQGIKCLDELFNLILAKTYISEDLTPNATSVNAGNTRFVPNLQAVTDSMFVVSSLEHRAIAANVFSDCHLFCHKQNYLSREKHQQISKVGLLYLNLH